MKPWQTVASAGPLTLKQRGTEYLVLTDGKVLMGSKRHGSEDELAVKGCEDAARMRKPKVLIGGLGFGYTLRKALDVLPRDAKVVVREMSAALVEWNQTLLGELAGRPLDDARVNLLVGDVRESMGDDARFDAIVLDVDNGPFALSHAGNASLYSQTGLKLIHRSLAAKGTVVVWSAGDDGAFKRRLDRANFATTKTWSIAGSQDVLFIAKK